MATSGSTDFSVSRNDLIKYALLNVGAIGEGETPNSTQYTDGAMMLNLIVKSWNADGMPLWAIKQNSFALTASTSFNIGVSQTINTPRPLRIFQAWLRDTTTTPNIDHPLNIITREEYDSLSSKSQTGTPVSLYYDPQGGATAYGTIYLWPKPDATAISTYTCYITYQRPFEDFDATTDTPDFPQEWYLPLLWMLSYTLAPMYAVPLEERKIWLAEAAALKQQALNFGMEEGSVMLQPDEGFGK